MFKDKTIVVSTRTMGISIIALAALLWAIAASVAQLLFTAGISPLELAMARALIAAGGLALINTQWRSQPTKRHPQQLDWPIFALGISIALVTITYYVAIARLPVAVAVVIQYTGPALVVAWAALRTMRLPSLAVAIALVTAVAGVTLVSELPAGTVQLDGLGLLMAGLSAVFFASYTLLSEAVVPVYGPIGVMFRAFAISSLFWLAVQATQGWPTALFVPQHLLGVVFVGIAGTLVPFCLYCWGIQRVQSERGAIAATLEPVFAAIVAWLWLGQTLTTMQIMGGCLVLMAVIVLQRQKSHNQLT